MCPHHPVETISWHDAMGFIAQLNAKSENYFYRLPTEAEWEYAARAGTTTSYSFGESGSLLQQYGWVKGNSNAQTHDVGTLKANPWGLYDMHGNVWQWIQDWYGNYPQGPVSDPSGASSGSRRVVRGNDWAGETEGGLPGHRNFYEPAASYAELGFRVVRTR